MTEPDFREAAADAVSAYLRAADPERCTPLCRVGCPCDGGNEDAATGAPDAAQEIVALVLGPLGTMDLQQGALRAAMERLESEGVSGSVAVTAIQTYMSALSGGTR